MKIRNYKGASLEKLYQVINEELGPDAIVVPVNRQKGIGGLFGKRHELIAIVDDASSDNHLVSQSAAPEQIRELAALQNERWKSQEMLLNDLQREIKTLSARPWRGVTQSDVPAFAADWDPRFFEKVKSEMPGNVDENDVDGFLKEVRERLKVKENFHIKKENGHPHIVVFVGPTGSGKTTTLAKLAASWCLDHDLKVGLITTDTYRIAAVDQIKEYATLLGVDLRVAFSAGEAAKAAEAFSDKDVILVDTPGRNHYDQVGMAALRGTINRLWNTTVFLVVPAVIDRQSVPDIIKSFKSLKPNYLIMTKIDESPRASVLTTLMCETDCPVAFVTDGQRVPQDIRAANRDELAVMLAMRIGEKRDVRAVKVV